MQTKVRNMCDDYSLASGWHTGYSNRWAYFLAMLLCSACALTCSGETSNGHVLYTYQGTNVTYEQMTGISYDVALAVAGELEDEVGHDQWLWRRMSMPPCGRLEVSPGAPFLASLLEHVGQSLVSLGVMNLVFEECLRENGWKFEEIVDPLGYVGYVERLATSSSALSQGIHDFRLSGSALDVYAASPMLRSVFSRKGWLDYSAKAGVSGFFTTRSFQQAAWPYMCPETEAPATWVALNAKAYIVKEAIFKCIRRDREIYLQELDYLGEEVEYVKFDLEADGELAEMKRLLNIVVVEDGILAATLLAANSHLKQLGSRTWIKARRSQRLRLAKEYSVSVSSLERGVPVMVKSTQDGAGNPVDAPLTYICIVASRGRAEGEEDPARGDPAKNGFLRDHAMELILQKYLDRVSPRVVVADGYKMPSVNDIKTQVLAHISPRMGRYELHPPPIRGRE
jgi:hypothetical protein